MKHEEIKKIIRECREKTKIEFVDNGGFFTPRFKSINHIEVGQSKIISNPITIILEFFYVLFIDIRDFFQRLKHSLFPRPNRIYGQKANSKIRGKVTFARRNGVAKPIHHMRVEFWARTWWLQWRKLGEGISDDQGYYEIQYDRNATKSLANISLRAEVYQTTHIFYKDRAPVPHYQLFESSIIRKDDLSTDSFMLEDFRLELWEYREDFPTARVVINDREKDAPQYYTQSRSDALAEQFIPYELTKKKHLEQIRLSSHKISLESIQEDYPINLSRCIESKLPGYTRSDSYFGNRQMNGMNRGAFLPDKDNPDHYWIKYFGVCQYDKNDIYAFPDAEIKFELDSEGLPLPIEIHLTGKLTSHESDPWKKRVFIHADGEEWNFAKRIARVSGSVCTEVDDHYTGTHLNTEQFAIAAYRNLRINPIASLLLPHLKEVVLINHTADSLLLRDVLPGATALTQKGLTQRVADILGVQDWKGFQPMDPISQAHDVAATDLLFWEITMTYVNDYIDQNIEEIKKYWLEIYCFSNDLVENSVKVFLSDVELDQLSPEERRQAQDRLEYYSFKYSFDPQLKRERIGGELKALSPITKNDGSTEITGEDIRNLKESCLYMIFVATYLHTWINEHQYDELGELLYNCLGLRFGGGENGVLAPESDLRIAPDLKHSTQILWFVNLLSRTEFGFITRNEDGDVNPVFSQMLEDKKEEFFELGVEVQNIESRTNI